MSVSFEPVPRTCRKLVDYEARGYENDCDYSVSCIICGDPAETSSFCSTCAVEFAGWNL